jgi:beta-phosphoglucomutase
LTTAFLFDLDGTLTDSDWLHFEVMRDVFASQGVAIDWAIYATRISGGKNADVAAAFLPHLDADAGARVMDDKEALYRTRVCELTRAPGLTELLAFAQDEGIAMALVTNAPRANAVAALGGLGLSDRFDTMVVSEDVARGKPDPLPYLEALRRLGVAPQRAVAFEDSRPGVRSASGAGVTTIGVGGVSGPQALTEAGATLAAPDFQDPRVMALVRRTLGL